MDPNKIKNLANLLRNSGDKVLNSEFKLTLSASLLRDLNDSFTLITTDQSNLTSPLSFQVIDMKNIKSDELRDLLLIHDFVQKTIILCITNFHGDDYFDGIIDISKFHSLKILEIQKINIKQIYGIQPLRAQLKNLICINSLNAIDDIITYCGGDNSNGFVWNELKYADFSYNNLKKIDTSLEFVQWLQQLNLSHNKLYSCEAIKWLPNLKILNLSFNNLQTIPIFHLETIKRLQILNISHNYIETLKGLQRLDALIEFDLSNNYLLDHKLLLPLNTLIALKYLNLYGNPLYCHPNHRKATAFYLNENTSSVKFILDSEPLSKNEKQLIGNCKIYHHHHHHGGSSGSVSGGLLRTISRFSLLTTRSTSGQTTPQQIYNRNSQAQTPSSSVGSIYNFKLNESTSIDINPNSDTQMTTSVATVDNDNQLNTSIIIEKQQKRLRRRTVNLEESSVTPILTTPTLSSKANSDNDNEKNKIKSNLLISSNTDHLETKKQIEDLRKKYGASWLHSDNSLIKSVIGLNDIDDGDDDYDNEDEQKIDEINKKMSSKQLIDDLLGQMNNTQKNLKINNLPKTDDEKYTKQMICSTPKNSKDDLSVEKDNEMEIQMEDRKFDNTNSSVYKSVLSNDNTFDSAIEEDSTNILSDIYSSVNDEQQVSEPEDNENTYIVYGSDKNNEILLVVSDTSIKEKEILTGRTKTKWSLKILQSCDRIKSNTLRINFDTVKKDKKERVYTIEEGLCQELESYLRNILSKRLLSEMNQTVYRCVNCSCQFSRENYSHKKHLDILCPECKSSYVVEIHESPKISMSSTSPAAAIPATTTASATVIATESTPTPTNNLYMGANNSGEKYIIAESTSHGSIGSAGSLNESSSCSKISQNSQSSFDSNQSVAGSSTNERDLDLLNFGRNYESDVEILSNPSQSSIEVLDGIGIGTGSSGYIASSSGTSTAHSSRKTSEERRILQIPSLDTIDDHSISGNTNLWNYDLQNLIINKEGTKTPTAETVTANINVISDEKNFVEKEIEKSEIIAEMSNVGFENVDQKKNGGNSGDTNGGKKSLLSNVNLTESSSSGSVTDSICTTYEGSVSENGGGGVKSENVKNENNEIGSLKTVTSSKTVVTEIKDNKKDDSILSSMLGGLFQSTNILMSRTQKLNTSESTNSLTQSFENFKYNYEDFSDIDHRLKLYFYQTKFNDANEHFKCLVKSKILNEQTNELFDGIIVISTKKLYLMEIYSKETEDINKWLKQILNIKIEYIKLIQLLPWHIGLSFEIYNWGTFLLILQDILRTDSLLLFFANNPLPTLLEYQICEKILKKLTNCTNSEQIKMFSLLNKCEITTTTTTNTNNYENSTINIIYSPTCLFTTDTNLYLTDTNLLWLSSNLNMNIELKITHLMSNLLNIERLTKTKFLINFLDETNDKHEYWLCEFETQENTESCLNAIEQSWEKLFGVPLGCN